MSRVQPAIGREEDRQPTQVTFRLIDIASTETRQTFDITKHGRELVQTPPEIAVFEHL